MRRVEAMPRPVIARVMGVVSGCGIVSCSSSRTPAEPSWRPSCSRSSVDLQHADTGSLAPDYQMDAWSLQAASSWRYFCSASSVGLHRRQ